MQRSAVVLYDHLLTFNEETRLIWGKRITSVNALFYFNRLFTFSWAVANLLDFVSASTTQVAFPLLPMWTRI